MKKLGTMDNGKLLIEMTEEEYLRAGARKGVRKNVAYTNHRVDTVLDSIAKVFGLPVECLRIVNKSGRNARGDKLVRSVLDEYNYYGDQEPAGRE